MDEVEGPLLCRSGSCGEVSSGACSAFAPPALGNLQVFFFVEAVEFFVIKDESLPFKHDE